MRTKTKRPRTKTGRRVLVIDVGGTHVKLRIGRRGEIVRFPSGPKLSASDMVKEVRKLIRDADYSVVVIGYPGLVFHGKIAAEPHNLGNGWVGFDFGKAFGKPVRLINDAAMQAIGSYQGGRMLFLGLGTGLGATLIADGVVEPMEIGHMPYKHGRTFEDYVGERGLERLSLRKWRKEVSSIVNQLRDVLEVDYVVLGGGNAKKLKKMPKHARFGNNRNAFGGGLRIWEHPEGPLVLRVKGRSSRRPGR